MVGLGLNLTGVGRGGDPGVPLTARAGESSGEDGENVINPKTVGLGARETMAEVCSSSGSDDDSDDDAPLAERPTPVSRPAGLPSLGLKLGAPSAGAPSGSPASPKNQMERQTSLSQRKPPGLGLRIGGDVGTSDEYRPSAIDLESLRGSLSDNDSSEYQASELTIRREKFAHFEKHCTAIDESIYVSGEAVARDKELLLKNGITHIINCNAFVIPNYFEDEDSCPIKYKPLWIQDSPGEDITKVLYDCFDFILESRKRGGKVLVHCSQGVSRSVSVVISYLMWAKGDTYENTFKYVKDRRGIANPNMGFTCQMLQWRKRVLGEISGEESSSDASMGDTLTSSPHTNPKKPVRLYRLAPHSEHDPQYLLAKTVWDGEGSEGDEGETVKDSSTFLSLTQLDARFAFVLQTEQGEVWVWIGSECVDREVFQDRALCFARQLFTYDGLRKTWGDKRKDEIETNGEFPIAVARSGEEPVDFLKLFRDYSERISDSGDGGSFSASCVPEYDADFQTYVNNERSLVAQRGGVALASGTAKSALIDEKEIDEKTTTSDASPKNENGFGRPKLLTYPSFEEVTMYDEDDLDESGVFVLLAHPSSSFQSFVWLGNECDCGGHALVFGGRVAEDAWERAVEVFGEAYRGSVMQVELEGKESHGFWEAFEAGQD